MKLGDRPPPAVPEPDENPDDPIFPEDADDNDEDDDVPINLKKPRAWSKTAQTKVAPTQ